MPKQKRIINLPISKHINVNFREYALYVLNNRGIPSFYDALTTIQRFILQNTPTNFTKTISVIGNCISSGYHHGDSSLAGAINKLARSFNCANQILEGDGFFGTPINHEAAAPRYTSVKINSEIYNIIKENQFLNTKDKDDKWNPFYVRIPIGLSTLIVGIGVGYKTTILPRRIEDIEKYLKNEIKEVKPYFKNFKGKIKKFKNLNHSWIIEGVIKKNKEKKIVHITSLPPLMRYEKFLKKIQNLIEKYGNKISVTNNSSDNIDILITLKTGDENEFENLFKTIENFVKIIVTETIVFVKDDMVLVYDKIEDYLDDFKYRIAELDVKRTEYFLNKTIFEFEYQKAKKLYLEFMIKKQRTENEISEFLKNFDKKISNRLENILLRYLSKEELKRTIKKIKDLEKEKKKLEKDFKKYNKIFEKIKNNIKIKGIQNRKTKFVDLFDDSDFDEIEGVEVFKFDEETESFQFD